MGRVLQRTRAKSAEGDAEYMGHFSGVRENQEVSTWDSQKSTTKPLTNHSPVSTSDSYWNNFRKNLCPGYFMDLFCGLPR